MALLSTKILCRIFRRSLYGDFIPLPAFKKEALETRKQFGEKKPAFLNRMQGVDQTKGKVTPQDVKTVVMLSSTLKDVDLTVEVLKKYVERDAKSASYLAFPLLLLLHWKKRPDVALDLYNDSKKPGSSPIIFSKSNVFLLMDLLYKHNKFEDALRVFDDLTVSCENNSEKISRTSLTLAIACCYRLNTDEALKRCTRYVKAMLKSHSFIGPRGVCLAAALAIHRNKPLEALSLLRLRSDMSSWKPTPMTNVRVMAFVQQGRIHAAVKVLQGPLKSPRQVSAPCCFYKDTMECVEEAVDKCSDDALRKAFSETKNQLVEQGHVTEQTLDVAFTSPINRTPDAPMTSESGLDFDTVLADLNRSEAAYAASNS